MITVSIIIRRPDNLRGEILFFLISKRRNKQLIIYIYIMKKLAIISSSKEVVGALNGSSFNKTNDGPLGQKIEEPNGYRRRL